MKSLIIILLFIIEIIQLAKATHLEPPDGKILFGPWYDRVTGDTIVDITKRFNYKKFSFVQSDINITDHLQYPDEFIKHLDDSKADTIMYLTVYPFEGFDKVTDEAYDEFVQLIIKLVNAGRRVLIRYASEMNGSWFNYGQKPKDFIASYRKVVDLVRSGVPSELSEYYSFLWAPNSGNGYPFPNGLSSITEDHPDFPMLDTNGDGELTIADDPYAPYYPGDDYVDWVGFSMYHYGAYWPWQQNVLPVSNQIKSLLLGINDFGNFNIYGTYCDRSVNYGGYINEDVSAGNKPFIITETAATFHLHNETSPIDPGPGRVAIKQAWWEQIFNRDFLKEFKKLKGVSTFEFYKFEEETLRDFTMLGSYTDEWPDAVADTNAVLDVFREAAKTYDFIVWANDSNISTATPTGAFYNSSGANNRVPQLTLGLLTITTFLFAYKYLF